MENKIYENIFNRILNNTEELDDVEKTTIISIYTMIVLYCMIHVFFLFFFSYNKIPEMVFVNSTSILICIINLVALRDIRRLAFGLILWISNSCYFILATTYILGYNKNSVVFLPILLLLIHFIFPKKKKYLLVNTILVFVTYFLHVVIKLNVEAKYFELFNFISVINNFCALVLSTLIIYLKSTTDEIVKKFTLKQLDSLAEEVDSLQVEASEDFLTGLWNRRYIEKQLESEDFTDAYVVLADLDFFKRVNDKYGHLCGDYVLKEVADLFKATFRNSDLVCRWGGEEFLIYLKCADQSNVFEKLERTRKTIEDRVFEYNEEKFQVTITFGFSKIDKDISIDKNVENADAALYYGKNNGRNCICCFEDLKEELESVVI